MCCSVRSKIKCDGLSIISMGQKLIFQNPFLPLAVRNELSMIINQGKGEIPTIAKFNDDYYINQLYC